jgi:hypothetical protein
MMISAGLLVKLQSISISLLTIDGGHNETNLSCIGSASEMGIDLFGLVLVQAHESVQDVVACQGVILPTFVIWEVVLHWAGRQLLLEAINLVQEQNDGSLDKPPRIADRIEESESFLHTVDSLVFEQQLIVLGNGDKEKDRCDIFEAMDPLLTF